MTGRVISHYRILGELGAGGMGVVYMAEDERLGRQVALKFLTADSTTDATALERFRLEARTASSLSHPGICALYDIGEHEGAPYIVMEMLKGESLRDRIERGPFKVAEIVDIGIQLADALDAAHKQGIIHRDIKPGNIFLTEKNRPKILDFGLAKLTATGSLNPGTTTHVPTRAARQSPANQITLPGTALGTVSYMSPEQARGEEVDERTDIFSLGVVLYEMATGRQAFGGSTTAVAFDGILNRQPPAIAHLNPSMPQRLESVIATAIEKDPDMRFQHAADLQAELKRVRRDLESGSVTTSEHRPATSVETPTARAIRAATPTAAPPPRATLAGVTMGLALVVAGGVGVYLWQGARGTPDTVAVKIAPPSATTIPAPPAATSPAPTPQAETPPVVTPAPAAPPAIVAPSPAPVRPAADLGRARTAQSRPPAPPPPARTEAPATTAPVLPPPVSEVPQITAPPPAPPAPRPADVAPPPTVTPPIPAPVLPAPAASAVPAPAPPARPAPESVRPPTVSPISDDAAIRLVVAGYGRAIETKDVTLFKSLRPSLSAAEEARLRESFRQIQSQQVAITINDIKINGRSATVHLRRTDTIVSDGRRLTQSSEQTLEMSRTGTSWVISQIGR